MVRRLIEIVSIRHNLGGHRCLVVRREHWQLKPETLGSTLAGTTFLSCAIAYHCIKGPRTVAAQRSHFMAHEELFN